MKVSSQKKVAFRVKIAIAILVVALFLFVTNQQFESDDFLSPLEVVRKSGMYGGASYLIAYAAFWGAVIGIAIRAMTKGLKE